jgi:hypothetical protein
MTETQKHLRRLAVLESMPFTNWDEVLEWYHLRRWVIAYDLLDQYREQHYFSCSEETTKVQHIPKNPKSFFHNIKFYFQKGLTSNSSVII